MVELLVQVELVVEVLEMQDQEMEQQAQLTEVVEVEAQDIMVQMVAQVDLV